MTIETFYILTLRQVLVAVLPCIRMFNHIGQDICWFLLPENCRYQTPLSYYYLRHHGPCSNCWFWLFLSQCFPMPPGRFLLDTATGRYQRSVY